MTQPPAQPQPAQPQPPTQPCFKNGCYDQAYGESMFCSEHIICLDCGSHENLYCQGTLCEKCLEREMGPSNK